jgi:hypothetical protein
MVGPGGGQVMPSPADELRMRLGHAITLLSPIARSSGPIGDWRDTWLAVTLANHELESILTLIRRQIP